MGLNMYVCHTLVTISVHLLWTICASLCVFDISVQLCVFNACRVTPGPLCSCQCPALVLRDPKGFLLGYADKLMLPDWLTAPSVAGNGHDVFWIPSDGHEQFSLSLCFSQTDTQTMWHHWANPEFQMGPAWGKSPKIQPKIWIRNLILNSGDLIWVTVGFGYWPLLHSSVPFLSLFFPFCCLSSSCSQILDSCFTLWKGGKVASILPIMP